MSKDDLIFELRRIRSRKVPHFIKRSEEFRFWRKKSDDALETLLQFVADDRVREIFKAMRIDEENGDLVEGEPVV